MLEQLDKKQTKVIRVLIVEDYKLTRMGLRSVLATDDQIEIVGEAENGERGIQLAKQLRPDVVLMDISMPIKNGIEATKEIRAACENTKVAILSMHHTSEYVQRAMQAGAHGYVLKDSAGSEVIAAIHALHEGKRYFSQKIVGL